MLTGWGYFQHFDFMLIFQHVAKIFKDSNDTLHGHVAFGKNCSTFNRTSIMQENSLATTLLTLVCQFYLRFTTLIFFNISRLSISHIVKE